MMNPHQKPALLRYELLITHLIYYYANDLTLMKAFNFT